VTVLSRYRKSLGLPFHTTVGGSCRAHRGLIALLGLASNHRVHHLSALDVRRTQNTMHWEASYDMGFATKTLLCWSYATYTMASFSLSSFTMYLSCLYLWKSIYFFYSSTVRMIECLFVETSPRSSRARPIERIRKDIQRYLQSPSATALIHQSSQMAKAQCVSL
jgi:hypothetical protein